MNPRREPRLRPLLGAAEIGAMPEVAFQHPLNARAVRLGRSLGDATGLSRVGVHLVRVRPGNETTEFHVHRCAEEFVYILSGRGIADLGEESVEVGAGDFMGFAAGGVPHSMRNASEEDLVYLVGGERVQADVVDYPRVRKRLLEVAGEEKLIDLEAVSG